MYISNKEIASLLRKVSIALELKEDQTFRIRAYKDAADTIDHYSAPLFDLWQEGTLKEVPGIGKSIAEHLNELFTTGSSQHLNEIILKLEPVIFELDNVPGIGAKIAQKLVDHLNIKTIDDVVQAGEKGKIAKLEGFGEKSQQKILDEIAQYVNKKVVDRILLYEADQIISAFMAGIPTNSAITAVVPVGSVRRRVPTVGDIDLAIETADPYEATDVLRSHPAVEDISAEGSYKLTVRHRDGLRIDVLMQPKETFGSLLQHFTGSKAHNIALRTYANDKGYSLSEFGIKQIGEGKEDTEETLIEAESEEHFYHKLGLSYIPPELREGGEEIAKAAEEGGIPDLISLPDVRGDLHVHSDYDVEPSHDRGHDTIIDLAMKAHTLGYSYLGLADHNPAITTHSDDEIKAILESRSNYIEQNNTSIDYIELINCIEMDISSDARLSISDSSLSYVTFVIAGIHSAHNQTKKDITKRLITAISHPNVHAISHPTGRLIHERESYIVDWDDIFSACATTHTILEINSSPQRLDLPDFLVQQAREYGVKFCINTDAHSVKGLNFMQYGVDVARRGWCTIDDIVNTWQWEEVVAYLRAGGKQI